MSTAAEFRQPRQFRPQAPQSHPYAADPTPSYRSFAMNNAPMTSNTAGWITFVYAQFGLALAFAAWNIISLTGIDFQTKSSLMMAAVFAVGATFTLAKTIRDEHENKRLHSRIEDARAEKLLMEVGRG